MFHGTGFYPLAALLFLAGLFSNTAVAQTVSIRLSSTNQTSLEAIAPLNVGYRLQASTDHEEWEDISDQASGALSYRIDSSKDQKRFFRLRTWPTEDAPITPVIIGDSTVADFESNWQKFYGWGHGIYGYLKPNVRVVNLSVPFQSSKTFLTSIQKDNMLTIKPDFVLIQFGLVDEYDLEQTKTTIPEYEANLNAIIRMVRDFRGTPVLVTPPAVRIFDDETGKVIPWMEDRYPVVQKLATELQTYLIDLNRLTTDLFNGLGPTESVYITWPDDPAHFSLPGAEVIAGLVVDAFPSILRSQVKDRSLAAGVAARAIPVE